MDPPIITLTTDFGDASPYVAAMKGVILSINPQVHLVDLSHQIPPGDIAHTAFFLQYALPYFPSGVIHVGVVDPGVGTSRALLYVEVGGQRILAPDNGCWTWLIHAGEQPLVRRLQQAQYWRHPVCPTFHGRDILAPVAAHLTLGLAAIHLGPVTRDWETFPESVPTTRSNGMVGTVVFVDHFGNMITNIPGRCWLGERGKHVTVTLGNRSVRLARARTYADAPTGSLVALVSSAGTLEIAVNQGNAAQFLGGNVGVEVVLDISQ